MKVETQEKIDELRNDIQRYVDRAFIAVCDRNDQNIQRLCEAFDRCSENIISALKQHFNGHVIYQNYRAPHQEKEESWYQ